LTATIPTPGEGGSGLEVLRPHAEQEYASELAALIDTDDRARPPSWRMSPQAVVRYLLGDVLADGTVITPKYIGPRRLIEVAVATLATDRALLLLGVPGTAKTWVSEHLAAAVSGDSTLLVQGTSGTAEEAIRYGWNYARLLAEGPSRAALVPSPVLTAMAEGRIARIEELTRIPSDVQDALITILSEKTLPVPELAMEVQAAKGFSVIATANDRDRGVNDLSSALRRRFSTVVLPLPASEGPRPARPAGGAGGDPPGGDRVPRAAVRAHRRRPDEDQVPHRDNVPGRGDLGGDQRHRAGRALRRRGAAPRRRCGRAAWRGDQGPGHRRRGVGRVPGGRGSRPARLG
jgi:hypothetical protein